MSRASGVASRVLRCMAIGTISALCVLGNALAGTCSSKGTGTLATPLAWNTGGNWTGTCAGPGGRPAAGDIVTVVANDVVVIDANANAGTLRVNGRLRFGANAATNVRSLTLNGTGTALTISNTGNFDVNQTSAVTTVTHTLTVSGGDISNAGVSESARENQFRCSGKDFLASNVHSSTGHEMTILLQRQMYERTYENEIQ